MMAEREIENASNPNLTYESLLWIEDRIRSNAIEEKDLVNLARFVDRYEKGYLLRILKEKHINSFEHFIKEDKKAWKFSNPNIEMLKGNMLGIISFLKKNLFNQR